MDFLKIIQSLEEFLYEAITWIIFYPRTLASVVRHPVRALHYAREELSEAPAGRYTETLSPPLFLMLSLALAHGVELAARLNMPAEAAGLMGGLFRSQQNLLIFRSLLYAIFPLAFAVEHLKLSGQALDRDTLRAPFYAQCYPASVFALMVSAAGIMAQMPRGGWRLTGLGVVIVAIGWYLAVQLIWFRQMAPERPVKATVAVLAGFAKAAVAMLAATLLLVRIG